MEMYTSRQAYSLLLNAFPLTSIPLLKTISSGGVESIEALQLMLQKVSSDCVLLIDEMYLQKGVKYHGGRLVDADRDGELNTGIMVSMIVSLVKSIPFVVKLVQSTRYLVNC